MTQYLLTALCRLIGLAFLCLCFFASLLSAVELGRPDFLSTPEHPIGFRGDGTGRFPDANPPLAFDVASGRNVRWTTAVGFGECSPVVTGKRVYVTADPDRLICLNADTGAVVWEGRSDLLSLRLKDNPAEAARIRAAFVTALKEYDEVFKKSPTDKATQEKAKEINEKYVAYGLRVPIQKSLTAATPITDGKRIYTRFTNGAVTAWNPDGSVAWVAEVETPVYHGWPMDGSSPLVLDGKVIVVEGPRYGYGLKAFAADTGALVWQSGEWCGRDRAKAFVTPNHCGSGTPAVVRVGGRTFLALVGGEIVEAVNGAVAAKTEGFSSYMFESPLAVGDTVYYQRKEKESDSLRGYRIAVDATGVVTAALVVEVPNRVRSNFVHHLGKLYSPATGTKTGGGVQIVDLAGKTAATPLPCVFASGSASTANSPNPCLAGKYIVLTSASGKMVFVDPEKPAIAAETAVPALGGTPFFAGGRIYLRTLTGVVCIEAR